MGPPSSFGRGSVTTFPVPTFLFILNCLSPPPLLDPPQVSHPCRICVPGPHLLSCHTRSLTFLRSRSLLHPWFLRPRYPSRLSVPVHPTQFSKEEIKTLVPLRWIPNTRLTQEYRRHPSSLRSRVTNLLMRYPVPLLPVIDLFLPLTSTLLRLSKSSLKLLPCYDPDKPISSPW